MLLESKRLPVTSTSSVLYSLLCVGSSKQLFVNVRTPGQRGEIMPRAHLEISGGRRNLEKLKRGPGETQQMLALHA